MTIEEAIELRHAVRSYRDEPIEQTSVKLLEECIEQCNQDGGLHIQLILNEPQAFDSFMAHYGKFSGVKNYIALIGKKTKGTDEKIGYYGEKIALLAQTLGLNTCWVAMSYKKVKTAFRFDEGEKLYLVIALGYGVTQGVAHVSKPLDKVCAIDRDTPSWFVEGVKSALLAPTAINQQQFFFTYENGCVAVKAGLGFYTKVDLGIVKYHFEIGARDNQFKWVD